MLVWRIQWHIMPKLQTRQYGFMPQRDGGLLGLRQRVVAGFENQLLVHKCPVNLYGMVMGYLRDREAFADDVVLMFSGQSASALEAETNRALAHVRDWGDRNKLRFAPSKTNAMVLTRKLKFDVPPGRPRLPGVESGDSQDDIRRRDRADSHVRFVRGPRQLKARRAENAGRATAQCSIESMPSLQNVSLHSALILARLLP
ncbi:hypothetical protein EVAR_53975_1 [Eumeta japonica]|uniref:Reverse transcriptase domain-containing protein n=1 Tax=Eumeta variegata TaxID=151549 RepID=A0A4C1Y1X6_EUMVA|nr:hypothetical protein EVAR_53975_1 [Eumeta japonica]